MNYIGKKIKELRHKADMTQEKLAEMLGVAYQTVSKWETGISSPDLSLIVPLARLFKVTTDELFCYSESSDDLLKEKLDSEYEETWKSGDLHKRFEISERAVREFPGDMLWLDRLAWAQSMLSFELKDDSEYAFQQEEAIKKFAAVIENAPEGEIRASSIQGIVQDLAFRGRNDEAKAYAELYPKNLPVSRDDVLLTCLCGEERTLHIQNMLDRAMLDLLNLIGRNSELACDAQERILEIMIPDKNYLYYNCILADNYFMRTRFMTEKRNYDAAIEMLKKAFYYAAEYDRCEKMESFTYTSPFFSLLEVRTEEIVRTGTNTWTEELRERLAKNPWYAPLRDREDFRALINGK